MVRNVELLEKTMQYIVDHPEQHKQESWFSDCGTAACFAGWACLLSGYTVKNMVKNYYYELRSPDGELIKPVGDGDARKTIPAAVTAQRLLGITDKEADELFYAFNSRAELELMVKDLVNGDELRVPESRREVDADQHTEAAT